MIYIDNCNCIAIIIKRLKLYNRCTLFVPQQLKAIYQLVKFFSEIKSLKKYFNLLELKQYFDLKNIAFIYTALFTDYNHQNT